MSGAGFVPRLVENRVESILLSVNRKIEFFLLNFIPTKKPVYRAMLKKVCSGHEKRRPEEGRLTIARLLLNLFSNQSHKMTDKFIGIQKVVRICSFDVSDVTSRYEHNRYVGIVFCSFFSAFIQLFSIF